MSELISQRFRLTFELRVSSRNEVTADAIGDELADFASDGKLGERLFPDRLADVTIYDVQKILPIVTCGVWGGSPGENGGLICTRERDHKDDHVAYAGATVCGQWSNDLDRLTRVASARLMAAYVGEGWPSIDAAEDAGREEARTGGGWQRQPAEALDFVYMEARDDEQQKMKTEQ